MLQPFEIGFICVCGRWKLYPRVLRDVSVMDLSTTVLGQRVTVPVCVAATAMQRMAHPHGETATARGEPCAGWGGAGQGCACCPGSPAELLRGSELLLGVTGLIPDLVFCRFTRLSVVSLSMKRGGFLTS